MVKFSSVLAMAFLCSCINPQNELIKNKKWRVVKQVITTIDKTGTNITEKVKDFSVMDFLYFDNAERLSSVSYGSTVQCHYKLKDSVLTYWPETAEKKANEYRIKVSTKDSLILSRTEIWGTDSSLKIVGTFHLAAINK